LPVVVVAFVVELCAPVEVLLSIVTLERPRRSMLGLTVELEPVIDEFTSAEDPVTEELVDAVGLAVVEVLAALFEGTEPVAGLAAEGCESGMQSWCTGLAECSAALPVDLSASLPALGLLSSLQSGLPVAEFAFATVVDGLSTAVVGFAAVLVFALSVNCAQAGTQRAAASAAPPK